MSKQATSGNSAYAAPVLGNDPRSPRSWPEVKTAPAEWELGSAAHRAGLATLSLYRPRRLPIDHPHRQPIW